jgi:hypothetical protein
MDVRTYLGPVHVIQTVLTQGDSFVEANLLIMCCCLSTLRRFFKHFAPRLIGESSTGSKSRSRGFSNNNAQHTFGSGGAKKALDSFMNTNNDNSGIPLSSFDETDKGGRHTTNVKSLGRDSDSEEAILFERSVQVTYSDAQQNSGRDVQSHQPKVWSGRRI